jgi:hypothetical protein
MTVSGRTHNLSGAKPLEDNWRILETVEAEAGVDADIARRSAAKQGNSRVVVIETNLAKANFAKALEAGDIDGVVRAIAPTVSLLKRLKVVMQDKQGSERGLARMNVCELGSVSIDELASSGWLEAIQSALVDVMLTLALLNRWTPSAGRQLQESVYAHWKSDKIVEPLLAAANGRTPVDGSSPMPVLVAFSFRTIANESVLRPSDRVLRDLYWIHQVANSSGRRTLEPLVVKAMAHGWRYVLEQQSFSLSMPMRYAPAIDAAIRVVEQQGIRGGLQLIEAAADAARVDISPGWQAFLVALGGKAAEAQIK